MIDPRAPDYDNTPVSSRRPSYDYAPAGDAPPAVSIVTPFCDPGQVFEETIDSVFEQSLQSWEWIIVNDASTDAPSLRLLDRCRGLDSRIRVIDLPANGGPAAARNAGCASARADYVLLLDSDDLLEPTAAEKWWWLLRSYPEFAMAKGYSVGFGAMEYMATNGFHDERAFLAANRIDVTSLIRTEAWRAAGGFPEGNRGGLEDWELWLRLADRGLWGGTVPEYLSWYRRRDDHSRRWPNWQSDSGSRDFRARLREEFPRLFAEPERFPAPRPPVVRPGAGMPRAAEGNRLRRAKPRLVMILPWLTTGGADKFNLDLARCLVSRGWEVSIATTLPGDCSWLPAFTAVTPDVFILPNFLRLADYPEWLRYLITSRAAEAVLVSNSELGYELLPYLRATCPGAAFLDFCHMEEEGWRDGGYPRQSVDHAADLDLSVVLSDHLRRWMLREGASEDRVVVCHNGVAVPPDDQIAVQRRAWRASLGAGGATVILYAGRIVEQKGPRVFADTLQRLAGEDGLFLAAIAGDGPELPALRASIERAGLLPRTRFLGTVAPDAMDGLLSAADVLFLPSKWEGMALVLHEAMARGVAVVSADVGGQRELVPDDCGILITPRSHEADVQTYAAALRRLIDEPDLRLEMGQRARTRVAACFRVEQMGDRMIDLIREAILRHAVAAPCTLTIRDAEATAARVTDDRRLQYVPYWEWIQAQQANAAPLDDRWPRRAFRSLTVLEPAYRWGLRRGWAWLPAVRRRLRGRVLAILGLET